MSQTATAISRSRRTTAFVVVAMLLIVSAIGLKMTVAKMQITFRKLPVELSSPLISIQPILGPWVQASVDRTINPDIEHELGTKEYVFRDYVDTRLLKETDREKFQSATLDEREKMIQTGALQIESPAAFVRFALTYYTGSADTVPHVSERCFVADGWKPASFEIANWPILPREKPEARNTNVRLMNFEDQVGSRSYRPRQVCYFFQVNGTYEQDPIFGVRAKLQNLFERHAYFAKIELGTGLSEVAQAGPVMQDFLTHAMPEIERVLPDWQKVLKQDNNESSKVAVANAVAK